jgi:hypothetical protein
MFLAPVSVLDTLVAAAIGAPTCVRIFPGASEEKAQTRQRESTKDFNN